VLLGGGQIGVGGGSDWGEGGKQDSSKLGLTSVVWCVSREL
jgi:hypothetical protein